MKLLPSLSTEGKKSNTHPLEPTQPTQPTSLSENDKKVDTPLLEPTQPTLLTSSVEESSKLQCLYCDYKGMEVDLDLHIFEKHRDYLRRLEHDSLDFNVRTDYVIERIKAQEIIQ